MAESAGAAEEMPPEEIAESESVMGARAAPGNGEACASESEGAVEKKPGLTCDLGHSLKPDPRRNHVCDVCGVFGTWYRCGEGCDYDACRHCHQRAKAKIARASTQTQPARPTSLLMPGAVTPKRTIPQIIRSSQEVEATLAARLANLPKSDEVPNAAIQAEMEAMLEAALGRCGLNTSAPSQSTSGKEERKRRGWRQRQAALTKLRELGAANPVEMRLALDPWLSSCDWWLQNAVWSILDMLPSAAVLSVAGMHLSHQSSVVRSFALSVLARHAQWEDPELGLMAAMAKLHDPAPEVRQAALAAVARLGEPGDADTLLCATELLQDPEANVQIAALDVLAQLATVSNCSLAVRMLAGLGGQHRTSPAVRNAELETLQQLALLGAEGAAEQVRARLCDEDPIVRHRAVAAVAQLAASDYSPEGVEATTLALHRRCQDPDALVRESACTALGMEPEAPHGIERDCDRGRQIRDELQQALSVATGGKGWREIFASAEDLDYDRLDANANDFVAALAHEDTKKIFLSCAKKMFWGNHEDIEPSCEAEDAVGRRLYDFLENPPNQRRVVASSGRGTQGPASGTAKRGSKAAVKKSKAKAKAKPQEPATPKAIPATAEQSPGGSVQKNARVPRWQQLAKSAEQKTAAAAKQGIKSAEQRNTALAQPASQPPAPNSTDDPGLAGMNVLEQRAANAVRQVSQSAAADSLNDSAFAGRTTMWQPSKEIDPYSIDVD